ncbi:MAG: glycosyltransferase WbuB [Deltaproteobacteria bacterium HGW-Deltaproteobacteria-18]|jgi:glycosyltransferase involved in cell wall biosynthesis|nr:MAG: glycosyltransferase WbuB [Deltaproteobacteria bacterium HGW-Deltaproteobacteria-18]
MILYYLCLQVTRKGQASYSHVNEIICGLRKRDVLVKLFQPFYRVNEHKPSVYVRVKNFFLTQIRLIMSTISDLVYVRWHFATFIVSLWARLRSVPIICEINGPYEDLFLSYPWTNYGRSFFIFLMRQQLKWADAVIAVTPHLVEWVRREAGHDRVFLVSNGANTDIFNPLVARSDNIDLPEKYVIFFGALSLWQGVETMLEAAKSPLWPSEVSLVIVGDGVGAAKVANAAASASTISFVSPVDQTVLAGLICNALCSLSPQVGQRCATGVFPLKLFESLACGVPVVVSDWPGMADLVRDERCGIVVPPGDAMALASAVHYIADNPEIAFEMGKRGADVVHREHSWDAKAAQTLKIIRSVLASGRFKD